MKSSISQLIISAAVSANFDPSLCVLLVFEPEQVDAFYRDYFIFNREEAASSIRKTLQAQKFVNQVLGQAAALNIDATGGDGVSLTSQLKRSFKEAKMRRWIQKSQ